MYVRSLYLQRFRNYGEAFFEFDPGLNLICGPNAQGKTSLLEALHYLMIGRSFRPCQNQDLIQLDNSSLYLEMLFCKHQVDQKLRLYMDHKERKIIYNSTPLPTISSLLGLIPGVVMTPDDVNLIKGAPLLRRQFLDVQIAQVDPLYVHYFMRYAKAMRQRNWLLRQKKEATLSSWEHEMAQAAAYLVLKRRQTVEALSAPCQTFYAYLSEEKEELALKYLSAGSACHTLQELQSFYLEQLAKNRGREMHLGYTLVGPHKDDLWLGIGGRDARYFASEGQQRSCVIALHIGEWQLLKQTTDSHPLLMVDDVGVSLDHKRRSKLFSQLSSFGQVFLTATDMHALDAFQGSKQVFHLPLEASIAN